MQDNIILIGMPGSGKSTLGVQLAKTLGLNFIDTDLLIQSQQGQLLQSILDEQGYRALRKIEETTLLDLKLNNHVVSTGGSAIYSHEAIQHLGALGKIVYLEVSFKEIKKRINNESSRGIAKPARQTLADVYAERTLLYEKYADITIDNNEFINIDILGKQLTET
ncbi:MAG: shikimate kinase [Cellvibrionaceae bacterium]|jgi:shikimate kinase